MISLQDMFWSLAEYGKDYVAGQDPIPEFNDKINESQLMAFDLLSSVYDKNERVRVLMQPFVRSVSATSDVNGMINYPTGFDRVLGGSFTNGSKRYPMYYAKENEIIESDFIPQRKADVSKGIVYYTYGNGYLTISPKTVLSIDLSYMIKPSPVKLVYQYNVSRNSYVQLDTVNTVNLEWNTDAYNLLLNILLLKYSLITRDQFKTEIATYGINTDLIQAL